MTAPLGQITPFPPATAPLTMPQERIHKTERKSSKFDRADYPTPGTLSNIFKPAIKSAHAQRRAPRSEA